MRKALCLIWLTASVSPFIWAQDDNSDWPTWGNGVQRRHVTTHRLARQLNVQWQVNFPAPQSAWPSAPQQCVDMAYEPILAGDTVYVGLNSIDEVVALDLATGAKKWSFYAFGPVRRPPTVYGGKLYFGSDDGHCYCIDAKTGKLLWKYFGGPARKYVLGNARMISQWPIRTDLLAHDGKVYLGCGVWPSMGTYLQALDADTGRVVWKNTESSNFYSRHPHGGSGISGLSPQGTIVLCGETLLVSNGRTRPMRFDVKSGKRLRYETGWQDATWILTGAGDKYFNGGFLFDLETGTLGYNVLEGRQPAWSFHPVVEGDLAWAAGSKVRRYDLNSKPMPAVAENAAIRYDYPHRQFRAHGSLKVDVLAQSPACNKIWIKAGDQLFVSQGGKLMALNAADGAVIWSHSFEADVGSVIAGRDRLLVSTRDGGLFCFGQGTGSAKTAPYPTITSGEAYAAAKARMQKLLAGGKADGICLVAGIEDGELVKALALEGDFYRVVAFDDDAGKIRKLHDELVAMGLYGSKVDLVRGDIGGLPPYLMNLICSEKDLSALDPAVIFDKLRPYGGRACFENAAVAAKLRGLKLSRAKVQTAPGLVTLTRDGALDKAAPWTHDNGTPGNTLSSEDALARGPLGVIWYGGPAGGDHFINRHDGAPRPRVVAGRVYCQKKDLMTCYDAYTGQILWQKTIPGMVGFLAQRAHIYSPRAFITMGCNMVALPDTIYVKVPGKCFLLDPLSGDVKKELTLPGNATWGTISILGDVLIVQADTQVNREKAGDKLKYGFAVDPWNGSVHRTLFALDRHDGEVLWQRKASYAYKSSALALGNGKVFLIDLAPQSVTKRYLGITPSNDKAQLLALDIKTGREIWKQDEGIVGTWLGYSHEADVLLEVPDKTIHGYDSVTMQAWDGSKGTQLYRQDLTGATGIVILGDVFLDTNRRECDIRTGRLLTRVVGQGRGCDNPVASRNMVTFRTSSSGYMDRTNRSGTVALPGFRPSCFGSLIPAEGLLNAPKEASGCVCNYSIYTSLAMAHMPEMDMWGAASERMKADRIGINLGAAGDRVSEDGSTFFQFPITAWRDRVTSPVQDKALEIKDKKRRDLVMSVLPETPVIFQYPSLSLARQEMAWVAGSGLKGLSEARLEFGRLRLGRAKVRLYFAEFEADAPGQRLLDVSVQGKKVLSGLDVFQEAGGAKRVLVKELENVDLKDSLVIALQPAAGSRLKETVLCGIELIKQ